MLYVVQFFLVLENHWWWFVWTSPLIRGIPAVGRQIPGDLDVAFDDWPAIDYSLAQQADLFVGNSLSTFASLMLQYRNWHGLPGFHYNGGTFPLEDPWTLESPPSSPAPQLALVKVDQALGKSKTHHIMLTSD